VLGFALTRQPRLTPTLTGILLGFAAALIWGTYLAMARAGVSAGLHGADVAFLRYGRGGDRAPALVPAASTYDAGRHRLEEGYGPRCARRPALHPHRVGGYSLRLWRMVRWCSPRR
jgi:hypothetical protein